jgi:hypothetical protein
MWNKVDWTLAAVEAVQIPSVDSKTQISKSPNTTMSIPPNLFSSYACPDPATMQGLFGEF